MGKENSRNLFHYRLRLQIGAGLISIGIILLFSFFIFHFLLEQLKKMEYEDALELLNTEAVKIELYIQNIDIAAKKMATDKNLQETLMQFSAKESEITQLRLFEQVVQEGVIFSEAEKMGVYIWDEEKELRYYSHDSEKHSLFYLYRDEIEQYQGQHMFLLGNNCNNADFRGTEGLSIIRRIYNSKMGRYEGYLEIHVSREQLEKVLNFEGLKVSLYDGRGKIYYPFTVVDEAELGYIRGRTDTVTSDNVFLQKNIYKNLYTVAVYYDFKQVFHEFRLWENKSIMLIAITLIASIFVISIYAKLVLKPLENLTKDIQKIKIADTELMCSTNYDREFRVFVETFNQMMERLSASKQRELSAIKQIERAKYEALQAQISPHFIQNVLFDLQIMIMNDEADEAYSMCTKLSFMLRYVMETKEMCVNLEGEINYVKNYLEMYQLQYENDFEYMINCPEEFGHITVPKLSIQPFIENSIKHGLYDVKYPWRIIIDCCKTDSGIKISIEDNGCGMKTEDISRILSSAENVDINGTEQDIMGIGMINTICRWKYMYDGHSKILIANLNPGLKIEIYIDNVQEFTHKSSI